MVKYFVLAVLMIAGAFMLTCCIKSDEPDNYEQNLNEGIAYLENNAKREGVVTTASGLQYEVLREGEGKSPSLSSKVRCHYEGRFINGKVFDSSYGGSPIVFPLSGVIRGWTEGLQYMTEGAKFRFVIPYQLGYGPGGYATIPPYSTLIFDVELIEVID